MPSRAKNRTIEGLVVAVALLGCRAGKATEEPLGASDRPPTVLSREVTFAFDSLDDRPVTSAAARGKVCVLALVTTWDLASQAQVNYLVAMAKNDGDAVFYALVAVQERGTRELVEAYAKSLKVVFPVALAAPSAVLGADAPFGEVKQVPTVLVLDRRGKVAWMRTGLARSEELRAVMTKL